MNFKIIRKSLILILDTWTHHLTLQTVEGTFLTNNKKDPIYVYGMKDNNAYKIGFNLGKFLKFLNEIFTFFLSLNLFEFNNVITDKTHQIFLYHILNFTF